MEKLNIYAKLHSIKSVGIKLKRDTKAYNYKYADLAQIQEKFSEPLQEQGLVVIHFIDNGKVVTEIRDTESDGFIRSEIAMSDGIKPQDKGSEITYYRRYNLLSLLDLEVTDDDGKKAQDSKSQTSSPVEQNKKWLNYDSASEILESGNVTSDDFKKIIVEDGYSLSQYAKNAMKVYFETGELDKNLFYKPAK